MAAAWNQRWAITLSVCNYSVKYRPSSHNSNADFFSRYPLENTNQESSHLTNQALLTELLHSPVTPEEISYSSQHDPVIFEVIEYVLSSEQLKPYY